MQSVIIAYMLTVALLIPASNTAGWRTDSAPPGLSGRHPAVYPGFLACAIANTLPMLVIARVLPRVGGLADAHRASGGAAGLQQT